jgi:alkylated DNA repair dioxygenase AlkB
MKTPNLLPYDGYANYIPKFIHKSNNTFFEKLLKEVNWKHDEITLYGKKIITKRQVAFEGDNAVAYNYSKQKKLANPWSHVVLELKQKLEKELNTQFNGCLLNLYATGEIGMAWHSDNEPELEREGIIASLSFGAMRTFQLKHKHTQEKIEVTLENGSLLIMNMESQQNWVHQLKKETKIKEARINLTFRQFQK